SGQRRHSFSADRRAESEVTTGPLLLATVMTEVPLMRSLDPTDVHFDKEQKHRNRISFAARGASCMNRWPPCVLNACDNLHAVSSLGRSACVATFSLASSPFWH